MMISGDVTDAGRTNNRTRHPDPDVIVNCARFGNMEPPGFARVWALFLLP